MRPTIRRANDTLASSNAARVRTPPANTPTPDNSTALPSRGEPGSPPLRSAYSPGAKEDLERLPNDGLRRRALRLIRDLIHGRTAEAERLDNAPRLGESGLDLRGLYRAWFDVPERR